MASAPFVTGHGFPLIFTAFFIACLGGTVWEETIYLIRYRKWSARTGTVIGPFSPIYGYGAAVFALILGPFYTGLPWWAVYLLSCLIGGTMEFMMSLVAEKVFHEVIWDYSTFFLNICGRTTVPFMLGWGAGGLLLMKVCYPILADLLGRVPAAVGWPVLWVLVAFMAVDLFLTYGALGRQSARAQGKAPGALGRFFDRHYPDDWLQKRFPAISFGAKKGEGHGT